MERFHHSQLPLRH